jgi:GNAT superfamily N-acetyltransferase
MISVVSPTTADTPLIASLFTEIDEFYGDTSSESAELRATRIRETLFGQPPLAYALIARDEDRLVGLGTYSFLWPAAGTSLSLYVKELFVSRTYRRRGVGRLLMQQLSVVALAHSCTRVEMTTERTNNGALRFYDSLEVPTRPEKLFLRIEGESIARLARTSPLAS